MSDTGTEPKGTRTLRLDTRAGFTSLRLLALAVAASVFVVLTLLLAGPSSAEPVRTARAP